MSIEFECPACLSQLKVGDETAGKMARCPQCQTVVAIPGIRPTETPPPVLDPVHPPSWEFRGPDASRQSGNTNPASATAYDNPYSPTVSTPAQTSQSLLEFRGLIKAAGIVQLVVNLLMLLLAGLFLLSVLVQAVQRGPGGDVAINLVLVVVGMGFQLAGAIGSLSMIRQRSYSMAIAGTILSMLSGLCCCLIPTLVGIFPLVVLVDGRCQPAFQQANASRRPS